MRRFVAVLVLAGALVVSALPASAAVTIRGSGSEWRPARVHVHRGERVRWRAAAGTHTVRAYGGNWRYSKRIDPGESVSRRFRKRGTFRFFCSIHGDVAAGVCTGMCGRVRVTRHHQHRAADAPRFYRIGR